MQRTPGRARSADVARRVAGHMSIWDDEPGPFAVREEPPELPRTDYAAELRALLEPVVATLGASDAVLVPAADTIGSVDRNGIAHVYAATIANAESTLVLHEHDGDDLTVFTLDERGALTIGLRDQVAPYLPPVDTPIPVDFSNPPGPPQPTTPNPEEPPPVVPEI